MEVVSEPVASGGEQLFDILLPGDDQLHQRGGPGPGGGVGPGAESEGARGSVGASLASSTAAAAAAGGSAAPGSGKVKPAFPAKRGRVVAAAAAAVMDFGDVFAGRLQRPRSFVLRNLSDVVLDFHLDSGLASQAALGALSPSAAGLAGGVAVLSFGTSSASTKRRVSLVSLPPKSSLQIFAFFVPPPALVGSHGGGGGGGGESEGGGGGTPEGIVSPQQ